MDLIYEGITTLPAGYLTIKLHLACVRMDLIYEGITTAGLY